MARNERNNNREVNSELQKKTVGVNRVDRVTKGGRKSRFSAIVVCGDGKNKIGMGMSKNKEVAAAVDKAGKKAEKQMITFPIVNDTIPHQVIGTFGRGKVLLLPAQEGVGVIAGGPVRAVLELTGIKNIRAKCIGTTNKVNCIKATLNALENLRTAEEVAETRNKNVSDL
ncbi:MAG: 30S ribosomal protein S5 [Clostridia bacterium]|nr:30S ribosomal protein S5 [Clostridia bacterium]